MGWCGWRKWCEEEMEVTEERECTKKERGGYNVQYRVYRVGNISY